MGRQPNIEARENILETARRLFHKKGYKGVSMDDIAKEAGVKKPNLFHYYPSKEELGAAVLERVSVRYKERITERFSADKDPLGTVSAMFDDAIRDMKEQACRGGCLIGNLAQELSDQSEALRCKISSCLRFWVEQLSAFLERAKARGYFQSRMKPAESAEALVSLLEGAMLLAKANKEVGPLENARKMAAAHLKGWRA